MFSISPLLDGQTFLFQHRDRLFILSAPACKSHCPDCCQLRSKTLLFARLSTHLRRREILPHNLAHLHLDHLRESIANMVHLLLHEFLFRMGLLHLRVPLTKTGNVFISFFLDSSLISFLTALREALRNRQMPRFPQNRTLNSTTCMNSYRIRIVKGLSSLFTRLYIILRSICSLCPTQRATPALPTETELPGPSASKVSLEELPMATTLSRTRSKGKNKA